MQPIYDSWDESYKQPFGAVARRSECIFSIFMPKDIPLDYLPVLVLFRTGFRERFLTMNRVEEPLPGFLYPWIFRRALLLFCIYFSWCTPLHQAERRPLRHLGRRRSLSADCLWKDV